MRSFSLTSLEKTVASDGGGYYLYIRCCGSLFDVFVCVSVIDCCKKHRYLIRWKEEVSSVIRKMSLGSILNENTKTLKKKEKKKSKVNYVQKK